MANAARVLHVMTKEAVFQAGNVQLRVGNRSFGGDGGPAVLLFAEAEGRRVQLLRFDCFRQSPHYHYDPTGKDDKRDLDRNAVPDPIAWTLDQLRNHLPNMIRTAGYEGVAEKVDQAAVTALLPEVEALMRG